MSSSAGEQYSRFVVALFSMNTPTSPDENGGSGAVGGRRTPSSGPPKKKMKKSVENDMLKETVESVRLAV